MLLCVTMRVAASGYQWCDADKKEELLEHGGAARFLIARKKRTEKDDSHRPLAFAHFRFTLQGEAVGVEGGQPTLYVMDLQLEPEVQRRGLGRHLMRTLELIGHKQGMKHMMIPIVVKDENTKNFVLHGLTDYKMDDLSGVASYDGQDAAELLYEDATFHIFSKALTPAESTSESAHSPAKKDAPSDGDLSAAPTPAKEPAASSSSPPSFSFDPTFGAAPAAAGPAAGSAADVLLVDLVSRGVIPAGMGGDAKVLLEGLMLQFSQEHGREPNAEDIAKWLGKLAQHAAEDADTQDGESDEDEEEEESGDEEESDDDE